MFKKILIILVCFSFTFAVYSTGQTVSINDQNIVLNNCDTSSDDYQNPIKLADWNGDLNGGDYHVIWLEMSASW